MDRRTLLKHLGLAAGAVAVVALLPGAAEAAPLPPTAATPIAPAEDVKDAYFVVVRRRRRWWRPVRRWRRRRRVYFY